MRLKKEFQRRLSRLYMHIYHLLCDDVSADVKLGNLMPLIFSVVSYYWSCKGKVLKK